MKRLTIIGLALATLLFSSGCQKLDDLEGRVGALEDRTAKIEQLISQLKTAVEGNYAVENVETVSGGYKLHFTNGQTIELLNGKDGKDGNDGTPGAPGKDGNDGTPGKDGDSFFKSVSVTPEFVTVVLNDDAQTTFVLPVAIKIIIGAENASYVPFKSGKTVIPVTIPAIENLASVTVTVIDGFVETKSIPQGWNISIDKELKNITLSVEAGKCLPGDSALLQVILAKKDGTTYVGSKAVKCTEGKLSYGGYDYTVVAMKDGRTWFAENLHYVPSGMQVNPVAESYTSDGSAGIWYPATFEITDDGKAKVTPTDNEDVVKNQGLLYNAKAVFGDQTLPTADFTDFSNPRGICPEGWHVPTAQEWLSLIGACANKSHNNPDAPYYNDSLSGAVLKDLVDDNFNLLPYPCLNFAVKTGKLSYLGLYLQKDNTKPFYGYCSMTYFHTSTAHSDTQSYSAMITNNATKSIANCAYNNLNNAVHVRCIRDL